jgi:hypothetical protein
MVKMIFKTLVHLFPFERLSVVYLYQLTFYILETLHRIESKLVGSSDYARLKEEFEQYSEVFDRNPALLQTEELWHTAAQLREAMKRLLNLLNTTIKYGDPSKQTYAKQLAYIAKPHLTPHPSHQGLAKVLTKGGKIAVDLQTPATTPMVAALELTALVAEIDTLAHAGDALYNERGDEKELRHQLGNATKRRPALTEALETVLYSLLQALHSLAASAADRAELDEIISHINGLLDSYKIYTNGGASAEVPDFPADGDDEDDDDGSSDEEPGDNGNDPGDGDPGNGGDDEGSGGPLDRGGITININE